MSRYLKSLIAQGEHQQLDFKFEISDSKRIARTLVAFANTDGGKLLIGVKDNGVIAGIKGDEEFYMAEAAANMYCKPEIKIKTLIHFYEGKSVLEIAIDKSPLLVYQAKDNYDKWKIFIRVNDKNILAEGVVLKIWQNKKNKRNTFIRYSDKEKILFDYLSLHPNITVDKFSRIASLENNIAENILTNLVLIDLLEIVITEKSVTFINKKN